MYDFLHTYEKIEKKFLNDISHYIAIDDDNLKVYSDSIYDLIVKCGVQIEKISKEICFKYEEREINSFNYRFEIIDNKFKISEKKVILAPSRFQLTNKEIKPFKLNNNGKFEWNGVYNISKHAMITNENMKKCNVENLILIIATLYLLNMFYKFMNRPITEKNIKLSSMMSPVEFFKTYSLRSGLFDLKIFNEYDLKNNNEKRESVLILNCYHCRKNVKKEEKMTAESYFSAQEDMLFHCCLTELSINR